MLTALLWLAASYGLNLYLELAVAGSPILGALGGGLILMIWFYLLSVSLLAGAELNAILLARRQHRAALTQGGDGDVELAAAPGSGDLPISVPVDPPAIPGPVIPGPVIPGPVINGPVINAGLGTDADRPARTKSGVDHDAQVRAGQ